MLSGSPQAPGCLPATYQGFSGSESLWRSAATRHLHGPRHVLRISTASGCLFDRAPDLQRRPAATRSRLDLHRRLGFSLPFDTFDTRYDRDVVRISTGARLPLPDLGLDLYGVQRPLCSLPLYRSGSPRASSSRCMSLRALVIRFASGVLVRHLFRQLRSLSRGPCTSFRLCFHEYSVLRSTHRRVSAAPAPDCCF